MADANQTFTDLEGWQKWEKTASTLSLLALGSNRWACDGVSDADLASHLDWR